MPGYRQNVVLVGPMGAGKSTIGRLLAQVLGLDFIDSDAEIEGRCGADIAWIFDVEGEAGFRRREQQVIHELCQRRGLVLSTGGGAILAPENRYDLARAGMVIYLQVSVEQQLRRTRRDRQRPLLQVAEPRRVLEELMELREPLYQEVADLVVPTDHGSKRLLVQRLVPEVRAFFSSKHNKDIPA